MKGENVNPVHFTDAQVFSNLCIIQYSNVQLENFGPITSIQIGTANFGGSMIITCIQVRYGLRMGPLHGSLGCLVTMAKCKNNTATSFIFSIILNSIYAAAFPHFPVFGR